MHKKEIEEILEGKGDFVKMDYLERYLKKMPPIEMRKFAYLKLAEIYLKKEMYLSAARDFKNAAINSVTFREKRENFLNESKAWISSFEFDEADKALKRALSEGNFKEKKEIYEEFVNFFKKQIKKIEEKNKPGHLIKIYEKFLKLKVDEKSKEEIMEKLLSLYEKLGKTKEYILLKECLNKNREK